MRGKRAKQIRRIAERLTTGTPYVSYNPMEVNTKYQMDPISGKDIYFNIVKPITLGLCTKKIIKSIKAKYKAGIPITTGV